MYTAHAKVRMQQRAIPQSVVNLLLATATGGRPPVAVARYSTLASVVGSEFIASMGRSFPGVLKDIGATTRSWPMGT